MAFGCFAITRQTHSSVSIVSNGCFLYTRLRHDHGCSSDYNVTDSYRILCPTKAVRARHDRFCEISVNEKSMDTQMNKSNNLRISFSIFRIIRLILRVDEYASV